MERQDRAESSLPHERRRVTRIPAATIGAVLVEMEATASATVAAVHDISVQGIGLVPEQDVPLGSPILIRPMKGPGRVRADVRHVRILHDGQFLFGCEFKHTLTMEDVLAFG